MFSRCSSLVGRQQLLGSLCATDIPRKAVRSLRQLQRQSRRWFRQERRRGGRLSWPIWWLMEGEQERYDIFNCVIFFYAGQDLRYRHILCRVRLMYKHMGHRSRSNKFVDKTKKNVVNFIIDITFLCCTTLLYVSKYK